MSIKLRSIIGIITLKDDKISLVLDGDSLISLDVNDDIDTVTNKYLDSILDNKLNLKQAYTFCEKNDNNMVVSVLYYGIINYRSINSNLNVVPLSSILENKYVKKIVECLKEDFSYIDTIKELYPGEFKLPAIQKIYELVLDKTYDRRNFRKKLLKLGIIEDLQKYSSNTTGRPAKLYRFSELYDSKDRIWF